MSDSSPPSARRSSSAVHRKGKARGKGRGGASGPAAPLPSLDDLQSRSERIAEWISANPLPLLGVMAAILLTAAVWGLVATGQQAAREQAARDLAAVEDAYRAEMGAAPGQLAVPEPANPALAREIRERYVERYQEVIDAHAGTPAAALAALSRGQLQLELGRPEDAIATWQRAAAQAQGPLRALLLGRVAAAHEAAGRFAEAAEAYEAASRVPGYPLVHRALADAARMRAAAGDADAAVALLQRLEAEAPDLALEPHVAARLRELRAARSR